MKISALIAAAALLCGSSVFAAQSVMDTQTEAGRSRPAVADKQAAPAAGGVVEKTKNVFRRMGDKMRHAGDRISDKTKGSASTSGKSTVRDDEQSPDTRAMGATGASHAEQARRERMDDAYSNWQAKQK